MTAEAELIAHLSHSPSMRSISADVAANAANLHNGSNTSNYILMNRSQDLTSLHSSHSTSISIQPQQQQQQSTSSHHGSGSGSTRKLSRILYEIGSILSFVGLGRDYKHHQHSSQQQQSSQTPTSLNNSILQPNTGSSSAGHSSSKTRRSQDKKLTPSTSTVNDHHP
jgi:hypothetical protein